jgi:hypothetical protein
MYWEQTVKIGKQVGQYKQIKRGVRQCCVLSPDLFSLYSEIITREIKEMPGVLIGGHIINNLRYADDRPTVLISNTEENLQELMNTDTQSIKKGLSLNLDKTETRMIPKKNTKEGNIILNGSKLRQVDKFKFLGAWITSDGRCRT